MFDESDERRFERLYDQHHDRVAAYLLSRTDRESAQDALSRTFEIAWRRFDDVPVRQLPWLLGVARRTLATQRRAQGRRDALFDRIAAGGLGGAHDGGDQLADRQLMAQALSRLTELEREAVLLVAWDGLSQREAAIVLGCSRVAVAVRVHRARQRLTAAMNESAESKPQAPPQRTAGEHRPSLDEADSTPDLIQEAT